MYRRDAISYHYPIPDWFAGEFDVRTGAELMALDFEMVRNAFMPSSILTLVGDMNDETEDESGYTYADEVRNLLRKFTGQEKDDNGLSGRQKLLLLHAANKEQLPDLQTLDIDAVISGSIDKRDANGRDVARLWDVHPVLLGYSDAAILGNTQAISNASIELTNSVESDQQLIEGTFKRLFPQVASWQITKFTPVKYIPDSILKDLTQTERRELVGKQPLEPAEVMPLRVAAHLNGNS